MLASRLPQDQEAPRLVSWPSPPHICSSSITCPSRLFPHFVSLILILSCCSILYLLLHCCLHDSPLLSCFPGGARSTFSPGSGLCHNASGCSRSQVYNKELPQSWVICAGCFLTVPASLPSDAEVLTQRNDWHRPLLTYRKVTVKTEPGGSLNSESEERNKGF